MTKQLRPLSTAKVAVTTRHRAAFVSAFRIYAARSGMDQWQVVEHGLNQLPEFRDVLSQEEEAYANSNKEEQRKQDEFVAQVHTDINDA